MNRDNPYRRNGKRKNRGWLRNAQDDLRILAARQVEAQEEANRLAAAANHPHICTSCGHACHGPRP